MDLKTKMRRLSVRSKRGYYALSTKQLQLRIRLPSTGGEKSKNIEINSIDKDTDTIPEGKEVLREWKAVGN